MESQRKYCLIPWWSFVSLWSQFSPKFPQNSEIVSQSLEPNHMRGPITNPFSPGPCLEHYFSVNRPILAEEVPGALQKTNTLQGNLDVVSLKLCCDNYHEETFFQSFTVFKYVKIKLPGIRLQKCEPVWLSCAEPNFIFASPQNILLPIVKLVGTPIWIQYETPFKGSCVEVSVAYWWAPEKWPDHGKHSLSGESITKVFIVTALLKWVDQAGASLIPDLSLFLQLSSTISFCHNAFPTSGPQQWSQEITDCSLRLNHSFSSKLVDFPR